MTVDNLRELGRQWPWSRPSFEEVRAWGELPVMAGGETVTYTKAKAALQESVIYDSVLVSAALEGKIGEHHLLATDRPETKRKVEQELRSAGRTPKIPDFIAVTRDGHILAVDSKRDLFTARAEQIEIQAVRKLLESQAFRNLVSQQLYPQQSLESLQISKGYFATVKNQSNMGFWSDESEARWRDWEAKAQVKGKTLGPKPSPNEVLMIEVSWSNTLPLLPGWRVALDLLAMDHEGATNPFAVVDTKDGQRRDINYYSRLGAACLGLAQDITAPVFQLQDDEKVREYIQAMVEGKNIVEIVTLLQRGVGTKRQVEQHIEESGYKEALSLGKVIALVGMKPGNELKVDETDFIVPKKAMSAINAHIKDNWVRIITHVINKAYNGEKDWSILLQRLSEDQQKQYGELKTAMRQVLRGEIIDLTVI